MTPSAPRGSLLVVDDDSLSRSLLRRYLTQHGFTLTDAADGEAALALLRKEFFDLVLLDLEMPGLSGLDVLERLRTRYSPAELPIMMATVSGATEDIVEALRRGANDYVTKPFNLEVVRARVQTLLSLKAASAQLADANRRMHKNLEAASRVQQALLPTTLPRMAGVEFAWHYRPCTELGGDLLGLVPVDEHRVWLYVLDVENHGVKAALLAVMVNRVLSRLLAERPLLGPADIAAQLNREFDPDQTQQYFTLMLGVLDRPAGTFRYVSAAHPGPLVLPRAGDPPAPAEGSLAIAMFREDEPYFQQIPYVDHVLAMKPGDRLYLYSDGVTDAGISARKPFGLDRCHALLAEARALPLARSVAHLLEAIESWTRPNHPEDDISLLALELT